MCNVKDYSKVKFKDNGKLKLLIIMLKGEDDEKRKY